MTDIILFDDERVREDLLPLTFTRPTGLLRQGILTIADKWAHYLPGHYSWLTVDYLSELFPLTLDPAADSLLYIAGHIAPTIELADAIRRLPAGHCLTSTIGGPSEELIAYRCEKRPISPAEALSLPHILFDGQYPALRSLLDIFEGNGEALCSDFVLLTAGRESAPISPSNIIIGPRENIFLEEGATVEGAIINANEPVYVAAGAEIMEGSCIRGGLCVGPHSHINMGSKVYGPTTLGPHCKIGGEVNNVVFLGYANKAHDGFLGNAVIGQWCNLGAGATASNLKNDYTEIKLWNYPSHRFARTGRQFCGLIMGDHSKAGINTMFNTATVVGVGVNIHGTGFPRNFVPSFTEGSPTAGFTDVNPTKFLDIARRVMARRDITLTPQEEKMYLTLYDITEKYR